MAEPTSVTTFDDLILAVAEKMGVASYGTDGTSAPAIPTNAQDLALCKRVVNNAIRMFIHDGPQPNGWRWLRPVASFDLWGDVALDSSNLISTATVLAGVTTLVVPTATFYATMELKSIVITGVGTFTISEYVSSTSVRITGSAATAVGKTFSIASNGNYTLPVHFGGEFLPGISFTSGTNKGVGLRWVDEVEIRDWRSNVNESTGIPYLFAVRIMDAGSPRRRWELLTYPTPNEYYGVQFPFTLHFNTLVTGTEVHPAPFSHDETVRAACLAQVEREVEHDLGVDWNYYKSSALPNSFRVDSMSAPKTLGYFWNPEGTLGGRGSFRNSQPRPTVVVNTNNA